MRLLLLFLFLTSCGTDDRYLNDCNPSGFLSSLNKKYNNTSECFNSAVAIKSVTEKSCFKGNQSNTYTTTEYKKDELKITLENTYFRKVEGRIEKIPYCLQTLANATVPSENYKPYETNCRDSVTYFCEN